MLDNSSRNLVLGKTPTTTAGAFTVFEVVTLIGTDSYYYSIKSTVLVIVIGKIVGCYEVLKLIGVRETMVYFGKLDMLVLLVFSLLILLFLLSALLRLIFLYQLDILVLDYPL